jgi:ubiquinone/menaquinone biosynthesis C-methylase UbiE
MRCAARPDASAPGGRRRRERLDDGHVSEHPRRPVVRDRYRPAEFEAERYSPDNLSFWTPVIIRLGRIQDDHEVLDLGCATGGLTYAVAESTGAHLVGCDFSNALLEYGRRVRGRTSIPLVCSDGAHLPFVRRSFDRIIASLVLHQVRDRQQVLAEISRALRPDGLLLIRTVTPSRRSAGSRTASSPRSRKRRAPACRQSPS